MASDETPNDWKVVATSIDLMSLSREKQLEEMEAWFRSMYEDPAERTPYESREGGYIWIWGGPYDAATELIGQYGGIVPDDVINELVDKLSGECIEWAPTEQPGDYDEGLFEAISSNVAAARVWTARWPPFAA
jgi:hypothetical protein